MYNLKILWIVKGKQNCYWEPLVINCGNMVQNLYLFFCHPFHSNLSFHWLSSLLLGVHFSTLNSWNKWKFIFKILEVGWLGEPGGNFGSVAKAVSFRIWKSNLSSILIIHSWVVVVSQVCIFEASSLFAYQVTYTLQGTILSN